MGTQGSTSAKKAADNIAMTHWKILRFGVLLLSLSSMAFRGSCIYLYRGTGRAFTIVPGERHGRTWQASQNKAKKRKNRPVRKGGMDKG